VLLGAGESLFCSGNGLGDLTSKRYFLKNG
jgi:hypothetical protein